MNNKIKKYMKKLQNLKPGTWSINDTAPLGGKLRITQKVVISELHGSYAVGLKLPSNIDEAQLNKFLYRYDERGPIEGTLTHAFFRHFVHQGALYRELLDDFEEFELNLYTYQNQGILNQFLSVLRSSK